MEQDPRILLALIQRDLANVQTGIAEIGKLVAGKASKQSASANDPRREAMREKMRQRALERWAKVKAGKATSPRTKKKA